MRKLIFVSSPLRSDSPIGFKNNIRRARAFCEWVMKHHNAIPIAPHVIFTQWLNDDDFNEQQTGLEAGFELMNVCDEVWIFSGDQTALSSGMKAEFELAQKLGKTVKFIDPMKVFTELHSDIVR